MPIDRAVSAFQLERKCCAESVLTAFPEYRSLTEKEIQATAASGHGRAEGGLCGALAAALQLSPTADRREQVQKGFVARAGSDKCREIRRARTVPCVECVRIAARLTAEHAVGKLIPDPSKDNV